jgi:uncharacterized protein YbjQ (UPF0145 family)
MAFGQRRVVEAGPLIIATTESLAGYRVERSLGQVFGVVVRSRGVGGNFMAQLRTIFGGEIREFSQMIEEARRHAMDRMATNAAYMGANAVLMMRFDSSEIGQVMTEVVAYGTAAIVSPVEPAMQDR